MTISPESEFIEDWRERQTRPVYSLTWRDAEALAFHVDDEIGHMHFALKWRLGLEGLRPECAWRWRTSRRVQLGFALRMPRYMLSIDGWRAIRSVGRFQHLYGDIGARVPEGGAAFAEQLPGRLRALDGRCFSLRDIEDIFLRLRGETLSREQFNDYMITLR